MANAAPFDYYRCRHEDFTSRREALNALIVEHETAWNQLTVDDKLHVCTVLHNTAQNLLQELQNAEGDSRYKEFQETYKSDIHHYTLISELVREQAQPELTWSNVLSSFARLLKQTCMGNRSYQSDIQRRLVFSHLRHS